MSCHPAPHPIVTVGVWTVVHNGRPTNVNWPGIVDPTGGGSNHANPSSSSMTRFTSSHAGCANVVDCNVATVAGRDPAGGIDPPHPMFNTILDTRNHGSSPDPTAVVNAGLSDRANSFVGSVAVSFVRRAPAVCTQSVSHRSAVP